MRNFHLDSIEGFVKKSVTPASRGGIPNRITAGQHDDWQIRASSIARSVLTTSIP